MKYLVDPKNDKQSVTLTFLVISFVLLAGFACASALGYVKSISALTELFYASAALYFGSRVKVGGKTFSMSRDGYNEDNS